MESDWDVIVALQRHPSAPRVPQSHQSAPLVLQRHPSASLALSAPLVMQSHLSSAPSAAKVASHYYYQRGGEDQTSREARALTTTTTTTTRAGTRKDASEPSSITGMIPKQSYRRRCPWLVYSPPSLAYGCKVCPDFQACSMSVRLSNLLRHGASQRHVHNAMPCAAAYGCPAAEDFAKVLSQVQTGRSYRHSSDPGAAEKKTRMAWCLGEALGDDERAFLKKALWM